MSSRRSRSPRSRSRSPAKDLPYGAEEISEADYFQKSAEFRVWLKDDKGKYFDELSSDKARSYFRKFVKAWNRGKLQSSIYRGVDPEEAAKAQTAYKWSFASKSSKADRDAVASARRDVESATLGSRASTSSMSSRPSRTIGPIGPTLPTREDLTLAREADAESAAADKSYKRKRERADALDRVEDAVGPRPVGREAQMEKKRARRDEDRAFRDRGDDAGLEADEGTLMGGGDSFRDHLARREAAKKRFNEKKATGRMGTMAVTQERTSAYKEKEKSTMDMFMKMAAERFG